jgi:hypothetical protein
MDPDRWWIFRVDMDIAEYLIDKKKDTEHFYFLTDVINALNSIKKNAIEKSSIERNTPKKFSERDLLRDSTWSAMKQYTKGATLVPETQEMCTLKSKLDNLLRDIVTYRATHAYHRFDKSRAKIAPRTLPLPPQNWNRAAPPMMLMPRVRTLPELTLEDESIDHSFSDDDR